MVFGVCSDPWYCTGEDDITETVTQFSEKENYIAIEVDLCQWVDERWARRMNTE